MKLLKYQIERIEAYEQECKKNSIDPNIEIEKAKAETIELLEKRIARLYKDIEGQNIRFPVYTDLLREDLKFRTTYAELYTLLILMVDWYKTRDRDIPNGLRQVRNIWVAHIDWTVRLQSPKSPEISEQDLLQALKDAWDIRNKYADQLSWCEDPVTKNYPYTKNHPFKTRGTKKSK